MSVAPIIDEQVAEQTLVLPGTPASNDVSAMPDMSRLSKGDRRFRVFAADAGFEILPTIDRVGDYCIEPNIFFSPRFCVPAMPRLDERQVRLMVLQDGLNDDSEIRFLMPFTIEKPGFAIGPDVIRAWANPYGPLGTPIVERREAFQVIEDLFVTIAMPSVNLPDVIVFPNVMADSPVVSIIRSVALSNSLPLAMTKPVNRPVLDATREADSYFESNSVAPGRIKFERQWSKLAEQGQFDYRIARSTDDIRAAMEEFLLLENAGWKGKQRTSLASDRYRAAFAREAVNSLAEKDKCRIYMLQLNGNIIASLIVFVEGGRAWTWKTTYDENLKAHSPGKLLLLRAIESFCDDPNIQVVDSCTEDDQSVAAQLWPDSGQMTSLVVGLDVSKDKEVRQAASQLELYASTRKTAKSVRDKLKTMLGAGGR